MKRLVFRFYSLIITFLLVAGCAKNVTSLNNGDIVYSFGFGVNLEEGRLYFDYGTDCLTFYDFAVDRNLPLCAAPNCTHKSESCGAYFPSRNIENYAVYRDKLYYWVQEQADQVTLYEADKNGTSRKPLLTVAGSVPRSMAVYADGKVFYDTLIEEMDEGNGEIKCTENLAYFDFETGKELILSQDRASYYRGLSLLHYHNHKVYFNYSYLMDRYDGDTSDILDLYQYMTTDCFVIDLETGQEDILLEDVKYSWVNGKYITYDVETEQGHELKLLDLDTMETQTIASNPNNMMSGYIFDGKIFSQNWFHAKDQERFLEYYDVKSGKTERIFSNLPHNTGMIITGETSDRFTGVVSLYEPKFRLPLMPMIANSVIIVQEQGNNQQHSRHYVYYIDE